MAGKRKPPDFGIIPAGYICCGSSYCSKTEIRVMQGLCLHYNRKTKQCNPSQQLLAAELNIDVRHVRRALKTLEDRGFIRRVYEGGHNAYEFTDAFYKLSW